MKTTIYIDVLVLVNFIINYFLLKATGALSRSAYNKKRLIFSAFISALCTIAIFLDIDSSIIQIFIKLLILLLTVFIAFGFVNNKIFIKNILFFILSNVILAGVLTLLLGNNKLVYKKNYFYYFDISPIFLVTCVLIVWIAITVFELIFKNETEQPNQNIKIHINNKNIETLSFYDTGFKLTDILGGKAVILIDFQTISQLLLESQIKSVNDFYTNMEVENKSLITPIFYDTINGNGVLPAIKPDKITFIKDDKEKELKNTLIAISKEKISNDIQIIYGKQIKEMLGD